MRRNALVDCMRRDQMPPKVAVHYGFSPRPPGNNPPLGSDYLLHRFFRPHDGDGDVLCLEQFPKRLKERPERGKHPDQDVGWGVYIDEGPHLAKIYTILALLVLFGSLLFAILFWALKRDVQGAFAVASYLTSVLSLSLGAWQMWILAS